MIVDHTLTPLQNILNLINETNGSTFTAEDFVLSDLSQTDFSGDVTIKNSSFSVECTLNNEFYGTQVLTFRRLYLQEIIKSDKYVLEDGDTLDSIKQMIADRYRLIASELVWDQDTLDVPTGEEQPFVLSAPDTSYVYVGAITITISKPVA